MMTTLEQAWTQSPLMATALLAGVMVCCGIGIGMQFRRLENERLRARLDRQLRLGVKLETRGDGHVVSAPWMDKGWLK